jgi:uncharacterized membrane-anchored protein
VGDRKSKHRERSKVPEIAVAFWILKLVVTALGWMVGEFIAAKLGGGATGFFPLGGLVILAGSAIGIAVLVWVQLSARRFDRWIYWLTMLAATISGAGLSSLAHLANASGFPAGALILLVCLGTVLFAWQKTMGAINVEKVGRLQLQAFYWVAILFAQALGIELGDYVAGVGLGYSGGAALFVLLVGAIAYANFKDLAGGLPSFWAAFVLSVPLAMALSDFLLEPLGHGGLELSPSSGGIVLILVTVGLVYILPQRSSSRSSKRSKA